jgi:hypothetical protein
MVNARQVVPYDDARALAFPDVNFFFDVWRVSRQQHGAPDHIVKPGHEPARRLIFPRGKLLPQPAFIFTFF